MAIVDDITHNYVILQPTQADLTGFKVNGTMFNKQIISGSDLGFNNRWVISKNVGGIFTFYPVEAPQMPWIWTGSISYLQTNFCPVRDENYKI